MMDRSSFVSNEQEIRRISTCLCFSVKWRLVLVLENWSNDAPRPFVFITSLELSNTSRRLVETTRHPVVINNTGVFCASPCFRSA